MRHPGWLRSHSLSAVLHNTYHQMRGRSVRLRRARVLKETRRCGRAPPMYHFRMFYFRRMAVQCWHAADRGVRVMTPCILACWSGSGTWHHISSGATLSAAFVQTSIIPHRLSRKL